MCVHLCVYVCLSVCMCARMYVCMCVSVYVNTHERIRSRVHPKRARAGMYACVHACVRACVRAHTHARAHTNAHKYAIARANTHTHTHDLVRACASMPESACTRTRVRPGTHRAQISTHARVGECMRAHVYARARASVCVWGVGQAGRRASIFLAGRFSSMFYFGPWITLMFTLNLAEILRFLGLLEKRWRFAGCSRRVGVPISVKLLFVFRGLARWVPLVIRLRRAAVAPKHSHLDGLSPASPKVSMGRKAGRPTIKCVLGRV